METKFLLPTKFKKIGWIVLILSIVCWGFSGLDKSSFFSRKVFAIMEQEMISKCKYLV